MPNNSYLMDPNSEEAQKLLENVVERAPITSSGAATPPDVRDPYQGGIINATGLQPDTIESQIPGKSPVYRMMPAPPSGQAQIVSAAKSVASQTPSAPAVVIDNDQLELIVPGIFTPPTQTLSSLPGILQFTLSPEPANTALMGPPSAAFSGLQSVAGGSTSNLYKPPNPPVASDISLGGNPATSPNWGFMCMASGNVTSLHSLPSGWIWETAGPVLYVSNLPQLNTSVPINIDVATISGAGGSACGTMAIFTGKAPTIVQSKQQTLVATGITSVSLTSPVTAGNSLWVITAFSNGSGTATDAVVSLISDNQGDSFYNLNSSAVGSVASGSNSLQGSASNVYISAKANGGSTSFNINVGGSGSYVGGWAISVWVMETTPIPAGAGIPYFRKIQSSDITFISPLGGVNVQTASYPLVTSDSGKLVVYNSGSAGTFTLPNSPPSTSWVTFIQNIGAGTLTVSPNGLNIDGSASSLTLTSAQGVFIATDGTNYFTERGLGGGSAFYQSVTLNHGAALTQRPTLNFSNNFLVTDDAGHTSTNVDIPIFSGGGTDGLVPNPGASPGTSLYLNADGQWVNPGGGGSGVGVDGITHTQIVWWGDPGFIWLRDDFHASMSMGSNSAPFTGSPGLGIGQLGWAFLGNSSGTTSSGFGFTNGVFPYLGLFGWENDSTASHFGGLLLNNTGSAVGTYSNLSGTSGYNANAWPLLDTNGWSVSYVFKFDNPLGTGNPPSVPNVYSMTQKAFYCGLMGPNMGAIGVGDTSARPDVFIGLRYDTSVSPNGAISLTGTTGPASGGSTTYNFSASQSSGAFGGYIGLTFVVAGFVNGVNNGTFVCTCSSSTTVTLNNASGVLETHAGTATSTGAPNDSTFKFEVVMNQQFSQGIRHNAQGTVVDTGISPTLGQFYRLDLTCTTNGSVLMTLTYGSGQFSHTFSSISKMTVVTNSGLVSSNNAGFAGVKTTLVTPSSTPPVNTGAAFPWAPGSSITVSGFTSTENVLNGTWTVGGGNSANGLWFDISSNASFTSASQNGTFVGYPGLQPCFNFGNDDTAAPTTNTARVYVDFFQFTWNPNLGTGGSPSVNKPRGW